MRLQEEDDQESNLQHGSRKQDGHVVKHLYREQSMTRENEHLLYRNSKTEAKSRRVRDWLCLGVNTF